MKKDDLFGLLGTTIDRKYRVDSVVGEGGFGVVYRAHHLGFDEPVAVKCLKLPAALDEAGRAKFHESFLAEGKLLHQLSRATTSVVQALDVGVTTAPDGAWVPYLVLEWLSGASLEDTMRARARGGEAGMPLAEAMAMLEPAARALAVAHGLGIAHRDIKPANLFVTTVSGKRTLKVLDFGVAKVVADTVSRTRALVETGASLQAFTVQYGAPEQFNRKLGATGPWTDVFALVLVLVELASGRAALDGQDTTQLYIAAIDREHRPTLRERGVATTDAVDRVLRRALAIEPKHRHASAGELWDALEEALKQGGPVTVAEAPLLTDERGAAMGTGEWVERERLSSDGPGERLSGDGAGDRLSGDAPRESLSGDVDKLLARAELETMPAIRLSAAAFAATRPAPMPPADAATAPDRVTTSSPSVQGVDEAPSSTREAPRAALSGVAPGPAGGAPSTSGRAVVLAFALALLAGAGLFFGLSPGRAPPPPPARAPAMKAPVAEAPPPGMVRVPSGTFFMGTDKGGKTEGPPHEVTLTKAYWLDATEVTVEAYAACVAAGKCAPAGVHGCRTAEEAAKAGGPGCTGDDPAKARHPVTCVDARQAAAYCAQAGKRLPTEAEWERAARGVDQRTYPWGSEAADCTLAVFARGEGQCKGRPKGTLPVGSLPASKSPFGALDLAGNAWEWVADGWSATAYVDAPATDPLVPAQGDKGVMRGGSWDFGAPSTKATTRLAFPLDCGDVSSGFRCARTID